MWCFAASPSKSAGISAQAGERLKALSLWQPWASAIAVGAKRIETRHWRTAYRGPLAIHAAKRLVKDELIHIGACWHWFGALRPLGAGFDGPPLWDLLPFGAIVAVCDLVDCWPTESFTVAELDTSRWPDGETCAHYDWTERMIGDFSPGRFGWVLADVQALQKPIPWRGKQGLFEVPDDVLTSDICHLNSGA